MYMIVLSLVVVQSGVCSKESGSKGMYVSEIMVNLLLSGSILYCMHSTGHAFESCLPRKPMLQVMHTCCIITVHVIGRSMFKGGNLNHSYMYHITDTNSTDRALRQSACTNWARSQVT